MERDWKKSRDYSWTGRSLAGLWGEKLFHHVCNLFGLPFVYGAMAVAVPFFLALRKREREASFDFFSRVYGTSNRWRLLWHTYCQFWCWGACWADRSVFFGRGIDRFRFERRIDGNAEEAVRSKRGLIFLTAHLGNYGVGASMLKMVEGVTVNIALIDDEERQVRRFLDRIQGEMRPRIISLSGSSFSSIPILKCLRQGEIVGIQTDRVVDSNSIPVDFFGSRALFPKGPLALCLIAGAPILTTFTLKCGWKGYTIIVDEPIFPSQERSNRDLVLRDLAQKVAWRIEDVVRKHPHQWFNFYPYWIDSPGFQNPFSNERF